MPIYEYQCAGCGEVFEIWQKMSDPPPAEHHCGAKDVRRVLSNTSFRLKGSGWYMTDYPRSGAQADKSPANGSQASTGGQDGTNDSKQQTEPASKAEPVAAGGAAASSQPASSGASASTASGSSPSHGGGTSSPSRSDK